MKQLIDESIAPLLTGFLETLEPEPLANLLSQILLESGKRVSGDPDSLKHISNNMLEVLTELTEDPGFRPKIQGLVNNMIQITSDAEVVKRIILETLNPLVDPSDPDVRNALNNVMNILYPMAYGSLGSFLESSEFEDTTMGVGETGLKVLSRMLIKLNDGDPGSLDPANPNGNADDKNVEYLYICRTMHYYVKVSFIFRIIHLLNPNINSLNH